jgi:hypothetical protein
MILPNCAPSGGGDSSTEASDEDEDDSASVPVSVSGSNLVFTVESGIDPETVEGYIVGEPGQLIVEPYFDPDDPEFNPKEIENLLYVIKDVPLGEYDVIVQADTLLVDDGVKLQDGTRTNGIRLADVKFEADKNTEIKALSIPPMGTIEGLAKKFKKENHELIAVDFPGTKIPTRKTDAQGKYVLDPIPVGVHEVVFSSDGYQTARFEEVTVATAATTTNPEVILYPNDGIYAEVKINDGDTVTGKKPVAVEVDVSPNATHYRWNFANDFTNIAYVAIEGNRRFSFNATLEGDEGSKTIFVQVQDADGGDGTYSDTILFDLGAPKAPTNLSWSGPNPTGVKTLTPIWTKSKSTDIAKKFLQLYKSADCDSSKKLGTEKSLALDLASSSLTDSAIAPGGLGSQQPYSYKIRVKDLNDQIVSSSCSSNLNLIMTWKHIGTKDFYPQEVQYLDLDILSGTPNIPYVAFKDKNDDEVGVQSWDGTNWVDVGTPTTIATGIARHVRLALLGTEPVVAFSDQGATPTRTYVVKKFSGGNWTTQIGADGPARSEEMDLVTVGSNLYLGYMQNDADDEPYVATNSGGAWSTIGGGPIDTVDSNQVRVATDGTNHFSAFIDNDDSSKIKVYSSAGGVWTNLSGIPSGLITHLDLESIADKIYVAFVTDNSTLNVYMKDGADPWTQVGSSLTQGNATYPSLATVNNEIYIAYKDSTNQKITTKKYDGTDWIQIGDVRLAEEPQELIFKVVNGRAYLGYIGDANTKTNVMELIP